jgi:hypothetical protein
VDGQLHVDALVGVRLDAGQVQRVGLGGVQASLAATAGVVVLADEDRVGQQDLLVLSSCTPPTRATATAITRSLLRRNTSTSIPPRAGYWGAKARPLCGTEPSGLDKEGQKTTALYLGHPCRLDPCRPIRGSGCARNPQTNEGVRDALCVRTLTGTRP